MAKTKIYVNDVGEVTLFRRRGLKNIRVRVDHKGQIHLSLPWYVPKQVGVNFVKSKYNWLKAQQLEKNIVWKSGTRVADYILDIHETEKSRSSSRQEGSVLTIRIPKALNDTKKQHMIEKIIAATLRTKTEELLIPKTMAMAKKNNFSVKSVQAKKLKSRWGSCDHNKNITLNLYLYALPEELYNYVICHELAHTVELNHSKKFWQIVESLKPDYKKLRKELRNFSPGHFVQ